MGRSMPLASDRQRGPSFGPMMEDLDSTVTLASSVDVARDCIWQGCEQSTLHSLLETAPSLQRLSAIEKLSLTCDLRASRLTRSRLTVGEMASVSSMI